MGIPNTFPHELVGPSFSIYAAPAATARPAINAEIEAPWVLIGKNGNKSYAEEGVRVNLPQTLTKHRGYGSAGVLKMFRSEEDATVAVTLADFTLESIAYALNNNAVTEDGITRKVGLSRGRTVATVALLVRGPSPYFDDGIGRFWIPYAANSSSPEMPFRRDGAMIYTLQWDALVNPAAESDEELYGILEAEDETT